MTFKQEEVLAARALLRAGNSSGYCGSERGTDSAQVPRPVAEAHGRKLRQVENYFLRGRWPIRSVSRYLPVTDCSR